jgi:general secretion pathway protein E
MLAPEEIEALQTPVPLLEGGLQTARGKGCVKCRGTGYLGRTGIFELFSATPEVRGLVSSGAPSTELTAAARRAGLRSLREAAVLKLAQGLTSFEEVLRMTSNTQW